MRTETPKSTITGADRHGIRAADFDAQIADPHGKSPFVEKSREMIETIKVRESKDKELKLTAQAYALNELFYANAREKGIERDMHEIELRACMKYLNEIHSDRVIDAIERIVATSVQYDIITADYRQTDWLSLVSSVSYREDLKSGTTTIRYEIPKAVREHILASTHYAFLELTAFPKFKCKYTARLYPRLAYRASLTGPLNKKLEIAPLALAEELGFPMKNGKFVYGQFSRDVLQPILNDVTDPLNNSRFRVEMTEVRGKGRGHPVEKLVFKVTEAAKTLSELKSKRISGAAYSEIANDTTGHLPSALAIGRACTAFDMGEAAVISLWRAFIERIRPILEEALALSRYEGFILKALDQKGPNRAFEDWVEWHRNQKSKPSHTFEIDKFIPPTFTKPTLSLSFKPAPAHVEITVEPKPDLEVDDGHATDLSICEQNRRTFTEKLLLILDEKCTVTGRRRTYEDWVLAAYLDIEVPPWSCLALSEEQRSNLANALRRLASGTSANMRSTLKTLALAVVENDAEKITRVAKAVYASRSRPKKGLLKPFSRPTNESVG